MRQTKYEFQATLHRTQFAMLDAIAYEWLTAGGLNTPEIIDDWGMKHAAMHDEAQECIQQWGLDEAPDPSDPENLSHMELNGYTIEDMANAMRAFVEIRPDRVASQ